MRPKSKLLLLHLLLFFALLIPLPAAAQPISKQEGSAKIQNYLRQLAQNEPTERVALIVQKQTTDEGVEQFVERNGGTITRSLALINAFAAEVPAHLLPRLAQLRGVRQVSINAPVVNQNSALPGSVSAQDDFAAVAYNGSDGTFAWQSDWEEIGEADGADQGDVGVTAFWGGALQGLRLQGAAKGILRRIDLSQATTTQLQMSYRRKDFTEADYVALEVTTDQISWLEVARWNGPMTDGELLSATVDLTSYQTAQTAIRFVTSANLTTGARFYLDSVRIDFIPTWQTSSFTNQLYLPLAANSDGTPVLREGEVATFDKAAALAQPNDGRSNQCWNCINLGVLQNNYVKAINADDLWNVAPYVRGWGVTVAVVDSGISNHPDFNDYWGKSRIVQRVSFVPGAPSPDDFYGHGTHIAGAIAGLGIASAGRYLGVAPEAKLIDVKVMDDWGYGNTADVIAGLQWVFENRATYNIKVVNLSLNSRVAESYHESALNAALEVLWFNQITVVVSVGNGGKQRLYPPANDPFVITVGAADDKGTVDISDDTLSPFSAYGLTGDNFLKPDLVAPGANIIAPLSGDDNNLVWSHPQNKLPAPDTKYYRMSGTSMASAVVAGAVAVLLEDEPTLSPDQVKHRLMATARPFNRGESCATGAGYLDLQAAVNGTTTQNANTGLQASQMLWTGNEPVTWGSVSWNSVSWNSVSWNSVSWNSVSWNSVSWNSVSWNSGSWSNNSSSSGSCTAAIKKLILVNADTDQDIQQIYDGAIINIDAIGTRNLSVRAETVGDVKGVRFDLNNGVHSEFQNGEPYTLAGDLGSDYYAYQFVNGTYKVKATTYPDIFGFGAAGAIEEMEFVVAGSNRCELEGTARSIASDVPMRFTVQNQTAIPLEIFWLNTSGQRQSYGVVTAGNSWSITSYLTHPWVIARDTDNSCIKLIPDPGLEATVTIKPEQLTTSLATDSGFETGSNTNWGRWGAATVVNQNVRTGNYAMRVSGLDSGIWQTISGLQPNTMYRLRGFVKAGSSGNRGYFYAQDYGGSSIDTSNQASVVNSNGYTEMTLTFVTGANNTSAKIGFKRWWNGFGDVFIDDLHMARLTFGDLATLTAVHSKKCLGLSNLGPIEGLNVWQWACNGKATQKWRIQPVETGGYQLVSLGSNKCLTVSGSSTLNGAMVIQTSCNGANNQRWRIEPTDNNAFRLVALHSNKCLDVPLLSGLDGVLLQQWSCSGMNNQKWWIMSTN